MPVVPVNCWIASELGAGYPPYDVARSVIRNLSQNYVGQPRPADSLCFSASIRGLQDGTMRELRNLPDWYSTFEYPMRYDLFL
jgi:hypothetical protein